MSASLTVPSQSVAHSPDQGRMFRALLRREWLVHRQLLLAIIGLEVMFLLLFAGLPLWRGVRAGAPITALDFMGATSNVVWFAVIIYAMLAGGTFAGYENRAGSEEWEFSQPAPRSQRFIVRLFVSLIGLTVLYLPSLVLISMPVIGGLVATGQLSAEWGYAWSIRQRSPLFGYGILMAIYAGYFVASVNAALGGRAHTLVLYTWPLGIILVLGAGAEFFPNWFYGQPAQLRPAITMLAVAVCTHVAGCKTYGEREVILSKQSPAPRLVELLGMTGAGMAALGLLLQFMYRGFR